MPRPMKGFGLEICTSILVLLVIHKLNDMLKIRVATSLEFTSFELARALYLRARALPSLGSFVKFEPRAENSELGA